MGEICAVVMDNGGNTGLWPWRMGEMAFTQNIDPQQQQDFQQACPLNDSPSNDIPLAMRYTSDHARSDENRPRWLRPNLFRDFSCLK
jgi:hypothetical protein